jgi:hypothetical protein
LIRIFEQSIIQAGTEAQTYFHIPDNRFTGTLADLIPISGIVGLFASHFSSISVL